jgi:hypothetical protein
MALWGNSLRESEEFNNDYDSSYPVIQDDGYEYHDNNIEKEPRMTELVKNILEWISLEGFVNPNDLYERYGAIHSIKTKGISDVDVAINILIEDNKIFTSIANGKVLYFKMR